MKEIRPSQAQELLEQLKEMLKMYSTPEERTHSAAFAAVRRATEEAGYNGWTNYETWCVALWIDNEEAEYHTTRAKARAFNAGTRDPNRTPQGEFADWLKEYVEETMPELPPSLWSDLLRAAFSEVDWYEIAAHYLEEVTEVNA
jgi:hypothetical protein